MKWSVLDQSPVSEGRGEDQAIRDSLVLAQDCDRLGYERFWLSEHHALASIAGTAPEILAAAIAATTRRIRVGSAGVMLPHYSALKVAEQFRVLEAIAPGRIDLGVGTGAGIGRTHGARAQCALRRRRVPASGPRARLLGAQRAAPRDASLPRHHRASDRTDQLPQLWILGSSAYGAQLAAYFGLPYAFAYFFSDGAGVGRGARLVPPEFPAERPAPARRGPPCACGRSRPIPPREAMRVLTAREHWRVGFEKGLRAPLVSPEKAAAHPYTPAERAMLEKLRAAAFAGSAVQVAGRLRELGERLELDEIVINTWTYDPEARRHSYAPAGGGFRVAGAERAE